MSVQTRPLVAALSALVLTAVTVPAGAQELPHFPKAGPPQPLPEATCDAAKADSGAWLLGSWVAPETRFAFSRKDGGIAWVMDRQGGSDAQGWHQGAKIEGKVVQVSACTVRMSAGDDDFVFEGVLTDSGRIYGYAANKAGKTLRFVLRRER